MTRLQKQKNQNRNLQQILEEDLGSAYLVFDSFIKIVIADENTNDFKLYLKMNFKYLGLPEKLY